jgi:hypothetical protein
MFSFCGRTIRGVAVVMMTMVGCELVHAQCDVSITISNMTTAISSNKLGMQMNPCKDSRLFLDHQTIIIPHYIDYYVNCHPPKLIADANVIYHQEYNRDTLVYTNWNTGYYHYEEDNADGSVFTEATAEYDSNGNLYDPDGLNPLSNIYFGIIYYLSPLTNASSCTPTFQQSLTTGAYSDAYGYWTFKYEYDEKLFTEYTDDLLLQHTIDGMGPYPTTWSYGPASAYWSLTSTNPTDDNFHHYGSAGKMQYVFYIPACTAKQTYLIKWQEITTYPETGKRPSVRKMHEQVTADANSGVSSSIYEIKVPSQPSKISVAHWRAKVVSSIPAGGN